MVEEEVKCGDLAITGGKGTWNTLSPRNCHNDLAQNISHWCNWSMSRGELVVIIFVFDCELVKARDVLFVCARGYGWARIEHFVPVQLSPTV